LKDGFADGVIEKIEYEFLEYDIVGNVYDEEMTQGYKRLIKVLSVRQKS